MKGLFKKNIIEFQERELPKLIYREYNIPYNSKKIISLIGVRRSGKTSILFNLIKKLRQTLDIDRIIYINFEDDRLLGINVKDLNSLIEAYYELYPQNRDKKVYLFLDEVQNVNQWELFVRRIYDSLNIQVFVTGSSAKLLSAEIATSLRGRTISYEVFPFSFKEFLDFNSININLNSPKSLSYIKNSLDVYLKKGGLPETVGEDEFIQKKILHDYMDLIIYKDISERHNIKNNTLLKHLIKYCFTNIGTLLSFNKLYNEYKSQGFKLSKDSLFEYFSYLEDAYALFKVSIYRNSVKAEMRNPKKIYAIDNGFKSLFSSTTDDYSKLYENIVFLHLRRQTREIYYLKNKQEVDFYTVLNNKKMLINVSYSIEDRKTKNREIKSLLEGMKDIGIKESFLINKEEEGIENIGDFKIYIKPLYKFLLEDH